MPVDFARIPPRETVPDVSRLSILGWGLLLCLLTVACATMAVFIWPGAKSDIVLFWFCAIALPIFTWSFLLCCRIAYLYGRINSALATNKTCDAIEARCHVSSSEPLAVVGHVWKFSSDEEENALDGLVEGKTKLRPVSSRTTPNTDVIARWLDVPGREFYAENALTEHARQMVVCEWLLNEMVSALASQLRALPSRVSMKVELCIDSMLDAAGVGETVLVLLKKALRTPHITLTSPVRELSLFRADSWFDDMHPDSIHLLVAVQLRNAVSETLANGVAESGSMLLVSSPSMAQRLGEKFPLWLHRPVKGTLDKLPETLELAICWGRASSDEVGTTWLTGLSEEATRTIRSSSQFGSKTGNVSLDTSVGNVGIGRAWLATTLGAANAAATEKPQLVIVQEGNDLLALVCERQI